MSKCEIDKIKLSNYLFWGLILTLTQLFFLEEINFFSVLKLILLNSFLSILIEFWGGKFIYKSWWQRSFLLNRTTGNCHECKKWLAQNFRRLIFIRFVISIPIIISVLLIAPYLTNVNMSINLKLLEKKIKSNKYIKGISLIATLNPELITGQKGTYYKIEFDKATYKEKVLFQDGEYTIDNMENSLLIPVNTFVDSIYKILDEGYDCALYVRGTADMLSNETFQDVFTKGYGVNENFSSFSILPKEGNSYSRFEETRNINSPFKNSDLPDLRGRFLQKTFEENFEKLNSPKILEGTVKNSFLAEDRNGFLLMYVDWESKSCYWFWDILLTVIFTLLTCLVARVDIKKWFSLTFNINLE